MAIMVSSVGEVKIIRISGDFTVGRARLARPLDLKGQPMDDLGVTLGRLLDDGHRKILLDLREVKFIDSAGLGELIAARKKTLDLGGDVKLLQPAPKVHELLAVTLLADLFEVHEDEAEAVASF